MSVDSLVALTRRLTGSNRWLLVAVGALLLAATVLPPTTGAARSQRLLDLASEPRPSEEASPTPPGVVPPALVPLVSGLAPAGGAPVAPAPTDSVRSDRGHATVGPVSRRAVRVGGDRRRGRSGAGGDRGRRRAAAAGRRRPALRQPGGLRRGRQPTRCARRHRSAPPRPRHRAHPAARPPGASAAGPAARARRARPGRPAGVRRGDPAAGHGRRARAVRPHGHPRGRRAVRPRDPGLLAVRPEGVGAITRAGRPADRQPGPRSDHDGFAGTAAQRAVRLVRQLGERPAQLLDRRPVLAASGASASRSKP